MSRKHCTLMDPLKGMGALREQSRSHGDVQRTKRHDFLRNDVVYRLSICHPERFEYALSVPPPPCDPFDPRINLLMIRTSPKHLVIEVRCTKFDLSSRHRRGFVAIELRHAKRLLAQEQQS